MNHLSSKNVVQIVYALFALSFILPPLAVAGAIVCYLKRNEADPPWLRSHFDWQLQSFWWMVAGTVVGVVTSLIYIGWLVMLAVAIWFLYRIVKGWLVLSDDAPVLARGSF